MLEMLTAIERALVQSRCLTIPNVYVTPDVDKSTAAKVKELIRRHEGTVTESEDDATHVIYSPLDPDDEEYARPAFRKDRAVLMHYYYVPDSYDSWSNIDLPWDFPEIGLGSAPLK